MIGARAPESGNTAKNRNKGRDVEKKEKNYKRKRASDNWLCPAGASTLFLVFKQPGVTSNFDERETLLRVLLEELLSGKANECQ